MSERNFNIIFSERLRFYLNKYDMTQLELSKRLGGKDACIEKYSY